MEINVGDKVSLPFNEEGIVIEYRDNIPWGYKYVVRITKGVMNFYGDVIDAKLEEMTKIKKKIVFFTGSGISKESGIDTFRDKGGLWDTYSIEDVATANAMRQNTKEVLEFYNKRRSELEDIKPNKAHELIASLENSEVYDVSVITQNVDDLHERAGSTNIIHLHGEITKACSMKDKSGVVEIKYNKINLGDLADDGSQLRPFVVLFGEGVPMIEVASAELFNADIVVVIGTSLQVYPAAGLVEQLNNNVKVYNINPDINDNVNYSNVTNINEVATKGMEMLIGMI